MTDTEITVTDEQFIELGYCFEAGLLVQPERGRYVVTLGLLAGGEREVAWEPAEPDAQKRAIEWALADPKAAVLDAIRIDKERCQP